MNAALATKVLNYLAVSSALTKRALDELSVHRSAQQKSASMRPDLLQVMLQVGAVGEHQKQAAEAMLGSHAETMGLLKMAVEKIGLLQSKLQKAAGDLGEGVEADAVGGAAGKQAGDYDSLSDPYVGRKTGKRKASDEAIMAVLNPPG